uniref:Uncharacterized protein n=1 Tax=Kalanchoe fedtschenkoi TaxID=63787 RepID=A0A7N0ZUM2_KALFE
MTHFTRPKRKNNQTEMINGAVALTTVKSWLPSIVVETITNRRNKEKRTDKVREATQKERPDITDGKGISVIVHKLLDCEIAYN